MYWLRSDCANTCTQPLNKLLFTYKFTSENLSAYISYILHLVYCVNCIVLFLFTSVLLDYSRVSGVPFFLIYFVYLYPLYIGENL